MKCFQRFRTHWPTSAPLIWSLYNLVLFLSVDNLGVEIDKTTLNFNCDADPGLIETNHNGTTMETTTTVLLSVGEIVGIVTAAATIVGTIGGVVIAAIFV